MAKQITVIRVEKPKKRGSQAKTKSSTSKTSKNYKKPYRGQGRWEVNEVDITQAEQAQEALEEPACALMGRTAENAAKETWSIRALVEYESATE